MIKIYWTNCNFKDKIPIFLFIIIDDNCQYWKNLDEMTLSSPNSAKWYNTDGVGCEWLISAPEGFIIALEFDYFHVSNLLFCYEIWYNT